MDKGFFMVGGLRLIPSFILDSHRNTYTLFSKIFHEFVIIVPLLVLMFLLELSNDCVSNLRDI